MAATDEVQDSRIAKISSSIRVILFSKPGIMFQDITTLLISTEAYRDTINLFVDKYKGKDIYVGTGGESPRSYLVISEEYSLEYGTNKIEMHVDAVKPGERAIIIDYLIATGGTLAVAIRLLERVGVKIVERACVIELPKLKGKDKLGETPMFFLVSSPEA